MLTVGNNELGGPVGETTVCPNCVKSHPVEYGHKVMPDGSLQPSRLLAYCKCPESGKTYLVGINGRCLPPPNRDG